ncbi:hypothetical protein LTR56_016687 [Elasticomyces elasticus]|nr:hypothetical protein LTR56_016687 [Elasticomyces elasticus]KAK3663081.1 hypothetical protein LTR22_005990 [Elasticomyces elasticus]KAK4908515.1 hypothetical protein LTR49_022601 [Elasticomyces elasticus]KAK5750599.1 hypothetical protein LTS12_019306 [Elasticomyces elasticus]
MPMLASVRIPRWGRSTSTATSSNSQNSLSAKASSRLNHYGKGPLPIKPSGESPRDARIVGRVVGPRGGVYSLKIGDVGFDDVSVDEILDWVSADHLEEFENQQFAEETEVIRIAELNGAREKVLKQERKAERAKFKKEVKYSEQIDRIGGDADDMGKHGRARPTYQHLFKLPRQRRRRRKRDPQTGELLPRSDEDEDSEGDSPEPVAARALEGLSNDQKETRRGRDRQTVDDQPSKLALGAGLGEEKKRRRRKRHPLTGELMPYGWRYEPNGPSLPPPQGSSTRPRGVGNVSPAMNKLSITSEQPAKRLKVDSGSSSSRSVSAHVIIASPARPQLSESGSSSDDDQRQQSDPTARQAPIVNTGRLGVPKMLQSTATSSAMESSPEPEFRRPVKQTPTTTNTMSIMQPAALGSADEESEDEGEEWPIEAILAHHMSDPRTHQAGLGNKSVMLYQVKWEGHDELTWEPLDSFPDRSVVDEYMRQVAAKEAKPTSKPNEPKQNAAPRATKPPDRVTQTVAQSATKGGVAGQTPRQAMQASASTVTKPSNPMQTVVQPVAEMSDNSEDDESDDAEAEDGSYMVEAIVAHHLSDPRTHAAEFGKQPVMLYKVKWKGYEGFTWEPSDSFEDRSIVRTYRAQFGLPAEEDSTGDEDTEMG